MRLGGVVFCHISILNPAIGLGAVAESTGTMTFLCLLKENSRGTWWAQLVECATFDLRVLSSTPILGEEIT